MEAAMRILLIEDNPGDARLLREMLRAEVHSEFAVTTVDRIASGLASLGEREFDLVLLDLSLPDSEGIDTLRQVRSAAPGLPIIVLTGLNREDMGLMAVREGAQDYLIKGQIDHPLLVRAIRYASERHRLVAAVQSLALVDGLTGLYNRRGFVTIASEQLKLARRMRHGAAVAFVDLDGMKVINDSLGHEAGDRALMTTASILKSTFRRSDVIARLGGDEFVVLAIETDVGDAGRLLQRLRESLGRYNEHAPIPQHIAFSVGFAHYDPTAASPATIEELIAAADQAMYADKQRRRTSRAVRHGAA
jgi:diguanylate cyclase (GGDEF)-like protein